MVTEEAFVPHTPDPELSGTAIVYFGVALPEQTIKAVWQLARRSKADPLKREQSIAELLRAQGYYVIAH